MMHKFGLQLKNFGIKIGRTQNSIEKSILNVKRKDKIRLTKIKHLLKTKLNMGKTSKKK